MNGTIAKIIAALVDVVDNFVNPVGLVADLADAVLVLSNAKGLLNSVVLNAALKIVQGAQAGLANLQAGQAATVATDTVDGATYSLVLVKNGGAAASSLGL